MSKSSAPPLMREVCHLIGAGRNDQSDGQLLDRFTTHRDEGAFEDLVRRYGRLVFTVCRQVLIDPHAAEDAFQATFLVLVHKAHSLDRSRPVGDYLYTVAFRMALRARANLARRRVKESEAARNRTDALTADEELRATVHEELNRLPDQHRVPLVLSYFEGKTYEQVAREIGCPVGSVGWRLARAKELLRDRLAGRGVTVPTAGLAVAMSATASQAAVPAHLIQTTIRAALWFAADHGAIAGVASAQAVELAMGAMGTMTTKKLIAAAGLFLAVGLCGGTAIIAAHGDGPKPTIEAKASPDRATAVDAKANLPHGATARMGTSRFRHGDSIFFIAYTPDGQHLVTAGMDLAIRLWDRKTGNEIRRFERAGKPKLDAPMMPVQKPGMMMVGRMTLADEFPITLSGDGKLLAAANGGVVTVWDVRSGKKVHELEAPSPSTSLVFTADGKSLASIGFDLNVTFWDRDNGKISRSVKPIKAGTAESEGRPKAVLSQDGKHFVQQLIDSSTGNGTMYIQNLDTGKEVGQIDMGAGGAQSVTFSSDGKLMVCTGFLDGVLVWDLAASKEVRRLGKEKDGHVRLFGTSMGLAADGKTLAIAMNNNSIELWDVTTGEFTTAMGGHDDENKSGKAVRVIIGGIGGLTSHNLALTPDGKTVAASFGNSSVRQFDAVKRAELDGNGGHNTAITAIGSSRRHVITVSRDSVRVWDAATGQEVRSWPMAVPAHAAAVSPNGQLIATGAESGTVQLWDAGTGRKVRDVDTKRDTVVGLAFSPDGRLLATKSGVNSTVNLWTVATGAHVRTIGKDGDSPYAAGRVTVDMSGVRTPAIVFSADGRLVASAGDKKQLDIWDVATGTSIRELPMSDASGIVSFSFSADGGTLAVLASTGQVTLYEVATGEQRCQHLPEGRPNNDAVLGFPKSAIMSLNALMQGTANGGGVAIAPDGRTVLAAAGGSAVRVWDVMTGKEIARLDGHGGKVSNLMLATDGRRLISGSVDTTAVIWDLGLIERIEIDRMAPFSDSERDALWADLANPDSQIAFAAIRKLLTDPATAVALMKDRIHQVPVVDESSIDQLIADLGGKFSSRRQATTELERLGEQAVPKLKAALEGAPPLDLKQRIDDLLTKAIVQKLQGDRLREVRAVELLERVGTNDARQVLTELAKGAPGARLTRDARSAVERLAQQPQASGGR